MLDALDDGLLHGGWLCFANIYIGQDACDISQLVAWYIGFFNGVNRIADCLHVDNEPEWTGG